MSYDSPNARQLITDTLYSMPYGGSVTHMIPHWDDDDFLDGLNGWLTEFQGRLRVISETTTSMAAELQELRGQRKAVRDFLGLPNNPGEPQ